MDWIREKCEIVAFAAITLSLMPLFAVAGIVLAIISPFIRTEKTTRNHYFKL